MKSIVMRRVFIVLVIAMCGFWVSGQDHHRPLKKHVKISKCGNDTLRYLLVNFKENKDRYIGKKMEFLLKELDFEIKNFYPAFDLRNERYIKGLCVWYLSRQDGYMRDQKKQAYYVLYIYFEETDLYCQKDWKRVGGNYWKKGYFDLFKDYTIRAIYITPKNTGQKGAL